MSTPAQLPTLWRPKLPKVPKLPALRSLVPAVRTNQDHTEFLPAHLEILETPASPKFAMMLWTLCAMLATALAWSCLARLDIYAEAPGRIQPSGRSKIVQPIDNGRVRAIHVVNGDQVKAGDVLIELDPTESGADRAAATAELQSLHGEIARRTTEIIAVQTEIANPTISFPQDVAPTFRARDESLFQAEMSQYQAQVESVNAAVAEKTARNQRLRDGIGARQRVIALMRERQTMKATLESKQAGTHAAVIDATQLLENETRSLTDDQGQILENDAATVSLQRKLNQAKRDFLATQNQHLTDALRRRDEVEQTLVKATDRAQRTRLTSPIDATVQQLAVTTLGQVVTVGQPLMVLVPSDSPLEIMALVQNQDIGFVKLGQEAVIKVDSFPFTHYGTLKGSVSRISTEAIDAQEATAASDASTLTGRTNASAMSGSQRVQNLVYPVTVQLDQHVINADGKEVPLLPGMQVTAEVLTGSRRVISYVLSPLSETGSQAAHER